MNLDGFLACFRWVQGIHPGQWTAECPAHEDRSRDTLSLALGTDDRRLVHCWAGCETFRVLKAARLTVRDLFGGEPAPVPRAEPKTYEGMFETERRRILADRARRFGKYRGELHASAAIREEHRAADAVRAVAARPDLDEEFRWELLACAAEGERAALALEAEQDERLRAVRPPRG